jgi:hypothetical protein
LGVGLIPKKKRLALRHGENLHTMPRSLPFHIKTIRTASTDYYFAEGTQAAFR